MVPRWYRLLTVAVFAYVIGSMVTWVPPLVALCVMCLMRWGY